MMKTSISTIVFFVVVLSISTFSLAKESPVEACIRRNIARALSPSPSDKPTTPTFEVADELCRDETRIIMFFLKLNGKFPRYYVKAMCKIFENDENKVKEYVTNKWLNHSEKLLNSLTCITRTTLIIKPSPLEACIIRNIDEMHSPPPPKMYHIMVGNDLPAVYREEYDLCKDETRIIRFFLELHGKFPLYYVKALCNVFGDEEKEVKEYVIKRWLNHSEKLINSLSCASL